MALSAQQLARRLNETHGHGWVYDARTRGAFNVVTQERISRRQLEKLPSGRLAEEGFTSFEAKAKARRAAGLTGYRQVAPGQYQKIITDPRRRKAEIAALPRDALVRVKVQGDDPTGSYPGDGRRRHGVWRTLNFLPAAGRASWMSPEDIVSVWDNRASRAGKVLANPKRWAIVVSRRG